MILIFSSFCAGVSLTSLAHYYYWYSVGWCGKRFSSSRQHTQTPPSSTTIAAPKTGTAAAAAAGNDTLSLDVPKGENKSPPVSPKRKNLLECTSLLVNHIGELPQRFHEHQRRRTRWPWDRLKKANSLNGAGDTENGTSGSNYNFKAHSNKSTRNDNNATHTRDLFEHTNSNDSLNRHVISADLSGSIFGNTDVPQNTEHKTAISVSSSVSNLQPDEKTASFTTTASSTDDDLKSSLCIGSIFGLDVGGTLAKLCYFEKSSNSSTSPSSDLYSKNDDASAPVPTAGGKLTNSLFSYFQQNHHHHRRSASIEGNHPHSLYEFHESENDCKKDEDEESSRSPFRNRFHQTRQRSSSMSSTDDIRLLRHKSSSWSSSTRVFVKSFAPDVKEHLQNRPADIAAAPTDPSQPVLHLRNGAPRQFSASNDDLQNLPIFRGKISIDDDSDEMDEKKSATESLLGATVVSPNSVEATNSSLRKVRSLVDFKTLSFDKVCNGSSSSSNKWEDHTVVLDRFYDFARGLDSYREGLRDHDLSFYSNELGGEFHFIRFETRNMAKAMDLIRANKFHLNIHEMGGTGGGAHKYASVWQEQLGITMKKQDELDSLVAGMQFVLSTVVGECYTFRPPRDSSKQLSPAEKRNNTTSPVYGNSFGMSASSDDEDCTRTEGKASDEEGPVAREDRGQGDEWWWSRKVQRDTISYSSTYPYLVVTIGTGVSVLRVDGPRIYERVSGSTIGGGTYLGLIRLLTDVEDFDDVMRLAERGDPTKVDMMVGDIYGENSDALEKLGLPSNLVASSFGKLVAKDDPAAGLKQEDLARALLLMITNNIGQVAHLNAKLFKTPRIYFVGNFLRQNKISQRRLSYAINYWSKGEMEALFLEHEGYFGALGAFLLTQDITTTDAYPRKHHHHHHPKQPEEDQQQSKN